MDLVPIKNMLVNHEGVRPKPYLDCCGKYWRDCTCLKKGQLTIGIGRDLDAEGVSKDEIDLMCTNDIFNHVNDLNTHLPWWNGLSPNRQKVMVDMCYQMGIGGVLEFQHFLNYLENGEFDKAKFELLDSVYAKETPERAQENAELIEKGG